MALSGAASDSRPPWSTWKRRPSLPLTMWKEKGGPLVGVSLSITSSWRTPLPTGSLSCRDTANENTLNQSPLSDPQVVITPPFTIVLSQTINMAACSLSRPPVHSMGSMDDLPYCLFTEAFQPTIDPAAPDHRASSTNDSAVRRTLANMWNFSSASKFKN